ncbi:hypothetical protein MNB_SM-7-154 [hydrothermal vent metagenome]|uniref:Uncharacterized protein n=1 Tax=hydrothermal vent metagenome TaxID=652676 RepID=A0A1W1BLQ0_9ZZZZ
MSRYIQLLLTGMLFSFILDFFLFLGIKLNYIDPLGVKIYYNILFVDNQNFILFFALSLFIGWLIYYTKRSIWLVVMLLLFALVFSTLIPPVGKQVGEALFMKPNVTLHDKKFTFRGDIYYIGRKNVIFYDHDLKKMIELDKTTLKENVDELY